MPSLRNGRVDAPSSGFGVTRASINSIEDYIADNKASVDKLRYGMDTLIRVLINIVRAEAMQRSAGPIAPRHRSVPALAFKIPVQRITGAYYAGWTLRRVRNAHWMLYNDSHEAWLIETGLYQRARRPILKLSVLATLRFIQTTRTAERFVDHVLAPRRNSKGQFQSFETRSVPFKMMATAPDLPNRGSGNPSLKGPTGRLPK